MVQGWGRSVRQGGGHGAWRAAVSGILVTALLTTAGCGVAAERADLGQALQDSLAAVRSVDLAVDLLQHQQTTRAAATVTAQDMSDEIGKAQRQLVDLPGDTTEIRSLRAHTQVALTQALMAVQETSDALAAEEDLTPAAAQLSAAERTLTRTAATVGER